ncbi:hypothetical protein [Nocardia cyriacigeorgica]|uniref:hypothetical protein n=1 Tax=Nocardia cyriacigeorgica TaxID=135487 RepID=UPI0013D678D7|nr:hypothetical protein [Nocardia cyriacigeorgica]NEW27402.1 hypothetical protein [Nocardia cyriacigeorgica]
MAAAVHPAPGPSPRRAADDLMQIAARTPLFFSSYTPLFAILAARFAATPWLAFGALALMGFGAACTIWVLSLLGSSARSSLTVARVHESGSESGGYLVSYVLPFLTVETPRGLDVLAYGLFLLVLLIVYVRTDLIQVNPMIYLLLHRIVKVQTESGDVAYVVVRSVPRPGDTVTVAQHAGIRVLTERR